MTHQVRESDIDGNFLAKKWTIVCIAFPLSIFIQLPTAKQCNYDL